jgi:hypothetical protein
LPSRFKYFIWPTAYLILKLFMCSDARFLWEDLVNSHLFSQWTFVWTAFAEHQLQRFLQPGSDADCSSALCNRTFSKFWRI